ncbi:MAG: hypothetical protein E6G76_17435 [Alphaproteobacteria bacterium]|nr:MAG: hypothetical protein E6G76_17435 [Alphaproteobacteria bacterium]
MRKRTTCFTMPAVTLLSSVLMLATAHAQQTAVGIPDNDSVYVDAKSFQVVPGKGKGDAAAQIRELGARELGPAAIIIRSGNKLYIAEGQTLRGVVTAYAYDPRQYNPALTGGGNVGYNSQFAYDPRQYNPALTDPRQYNPALTGGGSIGYNAQFANDPRSSQYNPSLTGGGSAGYNAMLMQFANDPRSPQYNPTLTGGGSAGYNAMLMQFAYDPDYVQYRLKKAFEENWIPASAK